MQQKKQNEVTTAKKYAEYRREKENGKKRAHQPHAPKWLKNPLTGAALTVALALTAFGTVYFVNRSRVVEPDSGIAGYYSMAQTVMGGGVEGAVLDSVNLSVDGEDTVIRMAFTGGVPSYTVSALSNPARVKTEANAMGMAAPAETIVVNIGQDVVATDEAGNLSLSRTLQQAAAVAAAS